MPALPFFLSVHPLQRSLYSTIKNRKQNFNRRIGVENSSARNSSAERILRSLPYFSSRSNKPQRTRSRTNVMRSHLLRALRGLCFLSASVRQSQDPCTFMGRDLAAPHQPGSRKCSSRKRRVRAAMIAARPRYPSTFVSSLRSTTGRRPTSWCNILAAASEISSSG